MTSPDAPSQSLLQAGLERHKAGDRAGAEACFRRAAEADPPEPTALFLLGLIRFEAGDADEAAERLEAAVTLRPDHAQFWLTLANLRQWRGENAIASEAYRRALALEPANAAGLVGLSQTLLAIGEREEAATIGEAAVAAAPGEAAAHLALASALAALKRPREAAQAYRATVGLVPKSAPAHLGLAVELLQLGETEAALPHAEKAVALDPTLSLAWFSLGTALRRIGRNAEAAEALEKSLALDPTRRAIYLSLGLIYIELDRNKLAERHLLRAVELDPDDKEAHASLSTIYCAADRFDLGRKHALRALELDPKTIVAHQNLSRILALEGREEEARRHRDLAFGSRNFYLAQAPNPIQRVLVLATTDRGNVPERHLLPADRYTRLFWFIEYAAPGQWATLPPYDVVFNGIGDDDDAGPTAERVAEFMARCDRPVFNRPETVARTRRHLAPALFAGVDGLVVPATARIDAEVLVAHGLAQASRRAGLTPPFLVRPIGSHGGHGLTLVTAASEAVAPAGGRDHYVTAFQDFRSPDGLYRKYRMIFVDREPYPYHLAIGPRWMVHYQTSGVVAHPERLAEERRFLEDPEGVLGAPAMAAVRALARRLDLDFGGADFALLGDGRVLLFEANATMLVHPEAPDGPLAHKNPFAERILEAFRRMLKEGRRADAS